MAKLLQCSDCARHLHTTESACPFCGAHVSAAQRSEVAAAPGNDARASRSKRYALRAALLAGAATLVGTGCGSAKKDANDQVQVKDAEENRKANDSRNGDRGPDMPYGCVWPDEDNAVSV